MPVRITLLIVFIFSTFRVMAKEPDLGRYKTDSAKIRVWADYCDVFLGNEEGSREDYPGLIGAGKRGMTLFKTDVARSLFSFYVGVGFEFSGISSDSAYHYYKISEACAIKAKNSKRLLNAHKQLIGLGTNEQKEAIANRMLQMRDTTKSIETQLDISSALYKFYRDKNQYEKAIQYQIYALQIRKEMLRKPGNKEEEPSNFINIGVGLTQIGDMYYRMGQPEKAMEYFREAIPYTGRYMDGAALVYNEMLSIFLDKDLEDSAEVYYAKVYALKDEGYESKEAFSYANRSYAVYHTGKKDMDKALAYAKKAYQLSSQDGGDVTMLESNTVMGHVYHARKEYKNALVHLLAVPAEARDYDKESYNELQFIKAECYAALGDWKLATECYRDHAFTKDTLLSEVAKKNIAEMEAKFQNKQKQQSIDLLNAEKDNARKQRLLLIGGIVLLLTVLLLLYINYRNKQHNARIMDAKNAALYEANKTKATLFSVISHDLRSPISQLYQYLQLQKNNPDLLSEEMKQKHSERIGNATASLLETMEDMLVWSKTQMERFVPAIEEVQVHLLVQDTVSLLGPDIAAKELTIYNEIGKGLVVHSDTNLLKIILRNLLLNAVQYSTKGSDIELNAVQTEGGTTISIKDEGVGMSDDVIALIRSNDQNLSSDRKGLGWALIKEMAESAGATIDIQRNIPKGTIVILNVPATVKKA
jgi:signal transduction histidine kinase